MRGLLLLLYSVLIWPTSSNTSSMADMPQQRTLTVSGEGILPVMPDQASVRFAVSTRHEDPEDARRLNAETSKLAMNAV